MSSSFNNLYVSSHYTTVTVTVTVTIDDSSFTSGTYGIVANGGTVITNRIVVSNNLEGLYVGGSTAIYLSNPSRAISRDSAIPRPSTAREAMSFVKI